jgi:hypothetical protein
MIFAIKNEMSYFLGWGGLHATMFSFRADRGIFLRLWVRCSWRPFCC